MLDAKGRFGGGAGFEPELKKKPYRARSGAIPNQSTRSRLMIHSSLPVQWSLWNHLPKADDDEKPLERVSFVPAPFRGRPANSSEPGGTPLRDKRTASKGGGVASFDPESRGASTRKRAGVESGPGARVRSVPGRHHRVAIAIMIQCTDAEEKTCHSAWNAASARQSAQSIKPASGSIPRPAADACNSARAPSRSTQQRHASWRTRTIQERKGIRKSQAPGEKSAERENRRRIARRRHACRWQRHDSKGQLRKALSSELENS